MKLARRNSGLLPNIPSFDDFWTRDLFDWSDSWSNDSTLPAVNIQESNDEFVVEMAAPGMKKDDFHVTLDNNILVISSEVEHQNEENNQQGKYTRREFSYQSFKRSFHLPNTVEVDKIKARYQDGVLRLVVPKKEEAKQKPPRQISIA